MLLCLPSFDLVLLLPPSALLRHQQAKALKPLKQSSSSLPAPRRPMLARPLVAAPVPSPASTRASVASADGSSNDKLLGVEKKTLVKVMALGAMFFSILFNYTILRDTKVRLLFLRGGGVLEEREGDGREKRGEKKRGWMMMQREEERVATPSRRR